MSHPLLAIAGQLDYGFNVLQDTALNSAIEACNTKLAGSQTLATNCQKANTILQQSLDANNKIVTTQQQLIVVLVIAVVVVLGFCVILFIKCRKNPLSPPPQITTPPSSP